VATLSTPEEPPPLILRFKTGELVHDVPPPEVDRDSQEQK
jgi:hypothetical protein